MVHREQQETKMTEEQKKEWAAMEDRLIPVSGKADTVVGEITRTASGTASGGIFPPR